MTKKITISVPDELHERMDKWKDSFNFSGVFQKAMWEAIIRKENFRKRIKEDINMAKTIERLSDEKAESEAIWFEQGKEDALEWVNAANYNEIKLVANSIGDYIPVDELEALHENFSEYLSQTLSHLRENLDSELDTDSEEFGLWGKGWMTGVREFWDEFKQQI